MAWDVTELTEVPGIVARACRTHRSSRQVQKCFSRTPGICGTGGSTVLREVTGTGMNVVQNLQKFRVRGTNVVENLQKSFVG